jgi:hypothetical protein
MSSNSIGFSTKDLKEAWDLLPKEKLIDLLAEKTEEVIELREKLNSQTQGRCYPEQN